MINWYKFKPTDTLFFRGAEPMVMGESHASTPVFPPPTETISGALRTSVLVQNNINFKDYTCVDFNDENILNSIGKYSDKNPFNVLGPLFLKNDEIFMPCPYCWFMESGDKTILQKNKSAKIKVIKSFELKSDLIKTSNDKTLWAKPENIAIISIGGNWIKYNDLMSNNDEKEIFALNYFVDFEQRTGIALHDNRKVRESHIYSFTHIRLKENVYLLFGVNKDLPLKNKGILKLGAEQRFGEYEKIEKDFIEFSENKAIYYISLSIVPKSNQTNNEVIATGKPIYLGGWDLAKGFHKEMIGYFPAGSVFEAKINKNFISIY